MCDKRDFVKTAPKQGRRKKSWAAEQIDRCIAGLSLEVFQHHIDTNSMTTQEVISYLASRAELELLPDKRSKFRKSYDRIITQMKHIRF